MTLKNNGRDLAAEKRRRLAAIQDDLRQEYTGPFTTGMLLLRCQTCKWIKPIGEFRRASANRYGLQVHCKDCRAKQKPYYEPQTEGKKRCKDCHEEKDMWLFPPCYHRLDGRDSRCRVCVEGRSKAFYASKAPYTTETHLAAQQEKTLHLAVELELNHAPTVNIKRCTQCRYIRPVHQFHRAKGNRDGTYNRCKDCMTGHPPDVSSHPDPLHYIRGIINL